MLITLLSLTAAALYISAGGLLARNLLATASSSRREHGDLILALATIGVIVHAGTLYSSTLNAGVLELGFTNAASLIAWVVAFLFLAAVFMTPIINLGTFVLPIAALAVLAAWWWPGSEDVRPQSATFGLHIAISVLAYAFLALAMFQAILLWIQERHLHTRHPARLLAMLPPMQTMETLLLQLIVVGYTLLSITLITGLFFSKQIFGSPLMFNHHTVLSVLAWVIFGTFLIGHWRLGWRGRSAVRWTIGGFVVLGLAYFGTKFVFEFILEH
ncbi:MAG: cytochrome c biogenesis protein CcsA [Gammaproteobacteria bacterium]|nr:cytochrome c biogenesis protein CcsA [Gammaproteobacteria bacterium]